MADDPDALWKPGNDGDAGFERGEPARFDLPAMPSPQKRRRMDGSRWGSIGAGAAVAALVVAAVAVIAADAGQSSSSLADASTASTVAPERVVLPAPGRSIVDEERAARLDDAGGDVILAAGDVPVSMGPSVCLAQRLPDDVSMRWSSTLDAVAVDGVVHVGDDVAVVPAVVETGRRSRTTTVLVGVDLDTGSERWRTAIPGEAVSLVGLVDEVLVGNVWFIGSERSRLLTAWSVETGAELWTLELGPGDRTVVEPDVGLLGLERFDLVLDEVTNRQFAFPGFSVLDPVSGEVVGAQPGRFDSVSPDGLLMTREAVDATFAQLRNQVEGGGFTYAQARVADLPAALIGDSLIRTDRNRVALQRWPSDPTGNEPVRELALTGSVRIDPPDVIQGLIGLDASSAVLIGGGSVHGANVGENVVEIRWRVDGTLVGDEPSDRGRTLIVRRDGGRLQRLVDSSTGRTILDVASVGNEVSFSDLLANGVIARSGVGSDALRRAVDLDGRTMWTLPGAGRLAVGDRVVIDWRQVVDDLGDEAVDVRAFGAVTASGPSCATANESFQGDPP